MRPYEETQDILSKWEHVLECLETIPCCCGGKSLVSSANCSDSTCNDAASRQPPDKILMLDLQYHDIHVKRRLYYLLARQGNIARIITDDEVNESDFVPPPNTRAKLRGELIKLAKEQKIHYDLIGTTFGFGAFDELLGSVNDPSRRKVRRCCCLNSACNVASFHRV